MSTVSLSNTVWTLSDITLLPYTHTQTPVKLHASHTCVGNLSDNFNTPMLKMSRLRHQGTINCSGSMYSNVFCSVSAAIEQEIMFLFCHQVSLLPQNQKNAKQLPTQWIYCYYPVIIN